jgi:hypothetical protein
MAASGYLKLELKYTLANVQQNIKPGLITTT